MDALDLFGPVWGASGVQNFFGQGWPYHERLKRLSPRGFDFTGMTFVAKTTTIDAREGNMPFDEKTLMNIEALPRCIVVNLWLWIWSAALNAVGLSGPGLQALLNRNEWQMRTDPFFISYAPQGTTKEEEAADTLRFVAMLKPALPTFRARVGLQLNISCPNTGENKTDVAVLVEKALAMLDILQILGIPIVVKLNVLMPPLAAERIAAHPTCSGLCVSNTIPWEALPSVGISRRFLFWSNTSPLKKRGFAQNGGLSGKPLLPLVIKWLREARNIGIQKHINAGGGIFHPKDVLTMQYAGASSVSLGSIAFLRPWQVQPTIQAAHYAFPH